MVVNIKVKMSDLDRDRNLDLLIKKR